MAFFYVCTYFLTVGVKIIAYKINQLQKYFLHFVGCIIICYTIASPNQLKQIKMKIQIEKEIEVNTDRNFDGLNLIISKAIICNDLNDFRSIEFPAWLKYDFFIYYGSSHIALHEILPTGEKSERLLLITK